MILLIGIIAIIVLSIKYTRARGREEGQAKAKSEIRARAAKIKRASTVITCDFCGTKFDTSKNSACPNCGAPYGRDKELEAQQDQGFERQAIEDQQDARDSRAVDAPGGQSAGTADIRTADIRTAQSARANESPLMRNKSRMVDPMWTDRAVSGRRKRSSASGSAAGRFGSTAGSAAGNASGSAGGRTDQAAAAPRSRKLLKKLVVAITIVVIDIIALISISIYQQSKYKRGGFMVNEKLNEHSYDEYVKTDYDFNEDERVVADAGGVKIRLTGIYADAGRYLSGGYPDDVNRRLEDVMKEADAEWDKKHPDEAAEADSESRKEMDELSRKVAAMKGSAGAEEDDSSEPESELLSGYTRTIRFEIEVSNSSDEDRQVTLDIAGVNGVSDAEYLILGEDIHAGETVNLYRNIYRARGGIIKTLTIGRIEIASPENEELWGSDDSRNISTDADVEFGQPAVPEHANLIYGQEPAARQDEPEDTATQQSERENAAASEKDDRGIRIYAVKRQDRKTDETYREIWIYNDSDHTFSVESSDPKANGDDLDLYMSTRYGEDLPAHSLLIVPDIYDHLGKDKEKEAEYDSREITCTFTFTCRDAVTETFQTPYLRINDYKN